MQALPLPPAYHCVKSEDAVAAKVKMFLTVSGDPKQIEAWLVGVKKHPIWKVAADVTANGVRFVRLSGPPEVPYKEIGGLIYAAQLRRLSVSFNSEPPICEAEDQ
ncbi:hypothetical protein GCM10023219_23570 [Stakelama sediminis]